LKKHHRLTLPNNSFNFFFDNFLLIFFLFPFCCLGLSTREELPEMLSSF